MALKIKYKMVNGDIHLQSRCSFRDGALFTQESECIVQAKSALEKYLYISADDGAWIVCKHIASIQIVNE